jgi:class 3 adenylate cyclase
VAEDATEPCAPPLRCSTPSALAGRATRWRPHLRVGINTGEVVSADHADVIGDPGTSRRACGAARDGGVVIGDSTASRRELVTLAPSEASR